MRERAPSRTLSPFVGNFQDMAARRPRQDDCVMHKVTPQPSRCHIPNKEHIFPSEISLFQKCRCRLCSVILSYPRRRLPPLLMRCSSRKDAQNPETTYSGKRGSPAGTKKSMGSLRGKKTTNGFSHMRGTCTSPCKRETYLRVGRMVDPVPG